jgi:hypothetical protein
MLAESQRALDESVRDHVHQEPEPAQYSNYKDFLDTEPPIFREAEESLQADEWLNTIEQKFRVLKVADNMKKNMLHNNCKDLQVFGGVTTGVPCLRI